MFNDKYQEKLEKDLVNIYKNYKSKYKIDYNYPEKLKKKYFDRDIIHKKVFPLVKIIIKDGEAIVNKKIIEQFKESQDFRIVYKYRMVKKTLEWCKRNNLTVPNTTLHFWITDAYPFYHENYNHFPLFVDSRPQNLNIPIFPDVTFECFTVDKKYSDRCLQWDTTKRIIKRNANHDIKDKQKKFYFKGTDTTRRHNNMRFNIKNWSLTNEINGTILLDAWKNYEPIYKTSEYFYLLNLPGHYGWSNRLKYLYLMKSIVININMKTIMYKDDIIESIDEKFISFIDYIIKPNNDFEYTYTYHMKNDNNFFMSSTINDYIIEENNKLLQFLKSIPSKYNSNKEQYNKMIERNYKKVFKLTDERMYSYIYRSILLNSEFFNK